MNSTVLKLLKIHRELIHNKVGFKILCEEKLFINIFVKIVNENFNLKLQLAAFYVARNNRKRTINGFKLQFFSVVDSMSEKKGKSFFQIFPCNAKFVIFIQI